jgi:hypothetical protein
VDGKRLSRTLFGFERMASTHDSRVSHDFSSTWAGKLEYFSRFSVDACISIGWEASDCSSKYSKLDVSGK